MRAKPTFLPGLELLERRDAPGGVDLGYHPPPPPPTPPGLRGLGPTQPPPPAQPPAQSSRVRLVHPSSEMGEDTSSLMLRYTVFFFLWP